MKTFASERSVPPVETETREECQPVEISASMEESVTEWPVSNSCYQGCKRVAFKQQLCFFLSTTLVYFNAESFF